MHGVANHIFYQSTNLVTFPLFISLYLYGSAVCRVEWVFSVEMLQHGSRAAVVRQLGLAVTQTTVFSLMFNVK